VCGGGSGDEDSHSSWLGSGSQILALNTAVFIVFVINSRNSYQNPRNLLCHIILHQSVWRQESRTVPGSSVREPVRERCKRGGYVRQLRLTIVGHHSSLRAETKAGK
jgi:hypothetical protein